MGHTPGSLSVLLPGGDAIVGDVLRGSGFFRSDQPTRHYFHEDCRAAEAHIKELYDQGARRFFVGHGGPVDAKLAVEHFASDPCP